MIQRLFGVFLNQRIDPYQVLYWTEDFVECTLSRQAEKIMRYGDAYHGTQEQGIFQFNVCIEESLINLRDGRFVKAVYMDHAYTLPHFQDEYQIIHQWFNVLGLTENDYKIDKPKRRRYCKRARRSVLITWLIYADRCWSIGANDE